VTLLVILIDILRCRVDEETLGYNRLLMLLLHLLLLLVMTLHLYSGLLLEELLLLLLGWLIVLLWRHLLLGSLEESGSAATGRAKTSAKCRWSRIIVISLRCCQRHGGQTKNLEKEK